MSDKKELSATQVEEFIRFDKTLKSTPKTVVAVLRVHLLSEHYLERLIMTFLPLGKKFLKNTYLSYSIKLDLVSSFDIIDERIILSLKNLNKIRNRCAHNLDMEITNDNVESIGSYFKNVCASCKKRSNNSTPIFLYTFLSFLMGALAKQTVTIEEHAERKPEAAS